MPSPLRVLILESQSNDVGLVIQELIKPGFEVTWQQVETEADYLVCLRPELDVVLADCALPGFDALQALHLLQERDLDIPFIVLCGYADEKAAMECMKQGAADYLFKDRLAWLGSAVSYALQGKRLREEKRQTEAALRNSERRYRRLYKQAQETLAKTQVLYRVSRSLITLENLPELLQTVVDGVAEALPADRVVLVTVDLEARQTIHFAKGGPGADRVTPVSFEELWAGLSGWVLREGKPALLSQRTIPDPREDPSVQLQRAEADCGAVVVVPLRCRDKTLGTMTAINRPDEKDLTQRDVELMSAVAGQVAVAIENVRLYTTARARADELALLNEIGLALTATLDSAQVVDQALSQVKQLFHAENVSLLQPDPQTGELCFVRALSGETPLEIPVRLQPGEGIAGWSLEHRQAVLVEDAFTDPRWSRRVDQHMGSQTRALIAIPLLTPDRAIGVLEITSSRPGVYTEEEFHILQALAATLAVALENARLYGVVARGKREWEVTFDALADGIFIHDTDFRIIRINWALAQRLGKVPRDLVGLHCYEVLDPTTGPPKNCIGVRALTGEPSGVIEQELPLLGGIFQCSAYPLFDEERNIWGAVHVLRDITNNKRLEAELIQSEKLSALGRLTAAVAHEVNNPLQAVHARLSLAQQELQTDRRPEEIDRHLRIAEHEIERISVILQRMRDFYRPAREGRQLTDLYALLDSVLDLTNKQLQHSKVTVRQEREARLPLLSVNPDHLKQVFLNLVLNAIDAMPSGGTLSVGMALDQMQPRGDSQPSPAVRVEFSDTGMGIPPEMLSRIFEPFFTSKERGVGLGLAVSHGIIQAHKGQITVKSEVGKGSTFTILLPITPADPLANAHSP